MNKMIFFLLFLSIPLFASASNNPQIYEHNLQISFDLADHTIKANDQMVVENPGKELSLLLNKNFQITELRVEAKKARFKEFEDYEWKQFTDKIEKHDSLYFQSAKLLKIKLKKKYRSLDRIHVSVKYSGIVYDSLGTAEFSRTNIADQTNGIVGEEGIYLSPEYAYYPDNYSDMSMFNATLITPQEYLTVTDGKLSEHTTTEGLNQMNWEGEAPTDGLYISGGKWELLYDTAGGVDVYGFFFPEDRDISEQYVGAVKRYLGMYDGLLGKYPYSKFAVVENFFSTGYGMPSWTLLGKDVVHLPWIVHISLGHEVCHNWWGNGVFVDYKSGNWCEGLTTYCADYLYKERKSESDAKSYRRNLNQDYTAYVNENNDFPLTDFRSRDETFTRTIGYGKSAMVFHMLRNEVGDKDFWKSLQLFYSENLYNKASWSDIRGAFEKQTEKDLGWFFTQWIDEKGAPEICLQNAAIENQNDQIVLTIDVQQTGLFKLNLPVHITKGDETDVRIFKTEPGVNTLSIGLTQKPDKVAIDPDFDVFRKLDRDEYPASLSEFFGAANQIIVIPSNADTDKIEAYSEMAEILNRTGSAMVVSADYEDKSITSGKSYLILGTPEENSTHASLESAGFRIEDWILFSGDKSGFLLMGESFSDGEVSCMTVMRNPLDKTNSIVLFSGSTPDEIKRTGRKLVHYGKYSYLAFREGKNQLKGNWEVQNSPLSKEF